MPLYNYGIQGLPGVGNGNYSSILAWRIPWTEEPGGLQSMGVTESWTRLSDQRFHFRTGSG